MITYNINQHNQPIDGNGNVLRLTSFPHFNGVNWFEFESEAERTAYIVANSPAPVWDKDAHIAEINEKHEVRFADIYHSFNYVDRAELSAALTSLQYKDEATKIWSWYWNTWELINDYSDAVTEGTAQNPQAFVNGLPDLDTSGETQFEDYSALIITR